MIKPFKKKSLGLILSTLLVMSCSTGVNNLNSKKIDPKIKNLFNIKSENTINNSDLTYYGSWSETGNIHQSTGTINNNNSSLVYSGNWLTVNNGATTEGNYSYTNSGNNLQISNDTSASITYTRNAWLTYSSFKYNDIPTSSKYLITNQETDINKIKYIYSGTLGGGSKQEAWSNSGMHSAWRTVNSGNINFTYSEGNQVKIEIPFTGTNIQIYQYKAPNRGVSNIKVYDNSNNLIRILEVDNYSSSWQLSKTIISGLPNGNNKLVIEGTGNKNILSSDDVFDFVRAEVMPSIEYKFTGNNINYNAFTGNNCGKVAVTIDNDSNTTQVIDLYNVGNIYQNVFSKTNLGSGEHTITIDGLQEKNVSSSGFRINVNDFNSVPSVRGEFNGTFLNLKLVGTPNSGKADLYIDGVLNRELDMYSALSLFYSINVTGLTNTNHSFELRAKNSKNVLSSGSRINFDGYTTNKASYTFTGTGIKYFADKKNNQGFVDVWIDGTKYGTYNLYSDSLQESQEIVNITGLTNEEHTIDFIPSGIKSWHSTGYAININSLIRDDGILNKVVWSGKSGTHYQIYTSLYDGNNWSNPQQMTNSGFDSNTEEIDIEGKKIIYSESSNIYFSSYSDYSFSSPINIINNASAYLTEMSKDGNTIVYSSGSPYTHIYGIKYNGTSWSSPIQISTVNNSFNRFASINYNGNKVVWQNENLRECYLSEYNNSSWSSPLKISASIDCNKPIINNSGDKIIFLSSSDDIYFSKLENGNWSLPTKINSDKKVRYYNEYLINSNSSMDKLVWTESTSPSSIYLSEYNGTSWSSPIQITGSSGGYYPKVNFSGDKVFWKNISSGHIYVSEFNGTSWSSAIQLSGTGSYKYPPEINNDGSIVVWSEGALSNSNLFFSKKSNNTWISPVQISDSNTTDNKMFKISN